MWGLLRLGTLQTREMRGALRLADPDLLSKTLYLRGMLSLLSLLTPDINMLDTLAALPTQATVRLLPDGWGSPGSPMASRSHVATATARCWSSCSARQVRERS